MLVSIHLNSNQPEQIGTFFDSVESTATDPSRIEILVNIDEGDAIMAAVLEKEMKCRRFRLKYTETALPGGFFDLWKPLNKLHQMTDPEAYYLLNVSDEFLFKTQGWDDIIAGYMGYYPDHIFRLRCSQFRFRNYQDLWECGFAPDSLAFYTQKWLQAGEMWNPCFGPDSFQQCVAYYLYTSDTFAMKQYHRDIGIPNMKFAGEGASIGLSEEAHRKRTRGHVRTWMILMSPKMQTKAKRSAMWLKAHIIAHEVGGEGAGVVDDKILKRMLVKDSTGCTLETIPYRVNRLKMYCTNLWRRNLYHYYAGGGHGAAIKSPLKGFGFYMWARYDWYYKACEYDWLYPYIARKMVSYKKTMYSYLQGVFTRVCRQTRDRYLRIDLIFVRFRLKMGDQHFRRVHSVLNRLLKDVPLRGISWINRQRNKSVEINHGILAVFSRRVKSLLPSVLKQLISKTIYLVCFIVLIPIELGRGIYQRLRKPKRSVENS